MRAVTPPPPSGQPGPSVDDSPLKAARLQRMARVESQPNEEDIVDPLDDEIRRYVRNEAAWRNTDGKPEKWWEDNESEFPGLAKLARIILPVPGSTAAVERMFSTAGWICSSRRGRLNGESLGLLVTSNGWMRQGIDRLVGLDDASKQSGSPILRQMDASIEEAKEKRTRTKA